MHLKATDSHDKENFEALYKASRDGILVAEEESKRFIMANPSICSMLGYSEKELIGKGVMDIHPKESLPFVIETFERQARGEIKISDELPVLRKDGSVFYAEINSNRILLNGYNCVLGLFRDITDRKKSGEDLRDSEMQFRAIFNEAPIGIAVIDSLTGSFFKANSEFAKITGRTMEELHSRDWMSITHPDDIQEDMDKMARLNAGEISGFSLKKRYIRADGSFVRVQMTVSSMKAVDHLLPRHLCMIQDITEREQNEASLRNLQKLESLGVLAGGIAHDFNNFLSRILGSLSLAMLQIKPKTDLHDLLTESKNGCMAAKDLTAQLLTFAKGGAPIINIHDLDSVLKDSCAFAARGSAAKTVFEIDKDLFPARVDLSQFGQVLHNLILNAVQAMPEGGTITIRASNQELEADSIATLKAGPYIRISIADQGSGIAEAHLKKVFDPYFTTKATGRGLGLASCHSIIKKHGGHINLESTLGKGTVFTFILPAAKDGDIPRKESPAVSKKGSGKILVMDDDAIVAKILSATLRNLGYSAEAVPDGASAIKLYTQARAAGKPFDLVIMDLTIPGGMGGKETIRELHKIDPAAKAIVYSGYSDDAVLAEAQSHGFTGSFSKPFTIEEISEVLESVLGKPPKK